VSYAMPYLEQLGEMLEREERGTVYNYLMWRVVMELMPYLPLRSSEISNHQSLKGEQSIKAKNHNQTASATSKHKNFKEEKRKS
jgi:hypothetical protein